MWDGPCQSGSTGDSDTPRRYQHYQLHNRHCQLPCQHCQHTYIYCHIRLMIVLFHYFFFQLLLLLVQDWENLDVINARIFFTDFFFISLYHCVHHYSLSFTIYPFSRLCYSFVPPSLSVFAPFSSLLPSLHSLCPSLLPMAE